jgi:hypothetical protein
MLEHHFALRDRKVSESAQVNRRPKALISQAFFNNYKTTIFWGVVRILHNAPDRTS